MAVTLLDQKANSRKMFHITLDKIKPILTTDNLKNKEL